MNFAETLSYLLSLGHETLAIKLGLRNTELLLAACDNPQQAFEVVQIAGTNGKGSTAAMLDSICRAAGIRTGRYTSPHLISITERITIAGRQISEHDFANYATEVRAAADRLLKTGKIAALPTFFEHLTVLALLAFRKARVRLVILETGLGGRLDATTAAGANTVAITPVALDHQEYLGETLAEIAFEKAAIIRSGVNAIVAPQLPEALAVILNRSAECGVSARVNECRISHTSTTADGLFTATFKTRAASYENLQLKMRGRHQLINAGVAIQLAEALRTRGLTISAAAIAEGIATAEHAGRLTFSQNLILDGAHNPAAAQLLREYLDEFVKGPLTLVFGAMRDKRLAEMAAILFPGVNHLILTQPDNPRSAPVELLLDLGQNFVAADRIHAAAAPREALKHARAVTSDDGRICATGSLYLIGELSAALQSEARN